MNPIVQTKSNIKLFVNEFGIAPDSFLFLQNFFRDNKNDQNFQFFHKNIHLKR